MRLEQGGKEKTSCYREKIIEVKHKLKLKVKCNGRG
jgi:hypothetical protein